MITTSTSNVDLPSVQSNETPQTTTLEKWLCDYCQEATFTNYEEACIHEESCRQRILGLNYSNGRNKSNNKKQQSTLSSFVSKPPTKSKTTTYNEDSDMLGLIVEDLNDPVDETENNL